jgi:hypothetical protein
VAVLRFFNEVFKDTSTRSAITPQEAQSIDCESTIRKLEFSLTPELERGVQSAKEKFDETVSKLKTEILEVTSYGRDYIKSKKLSPDAFMQLAFQVSLRRRSIRFFLSYIGHFLFTSFLSAVLKTETETLEFFEGLFVT